MRRWERVMKKGPALVLTVICAMTLCACSGSSERENTDGAAGVGAAATAGGASVSGAAAAVSDSGEPEESAEVKTVIDETGKSRKLRLGNIDLKDAGVRFQDTYWITDYSQVEDGHYYYLRYTKKGYTVYRDNGEIEGSFELLEQEGDSYDYPYVEGFVKCGEYFYVVYEDFGEEKLARVDMENHRVKVICDISKTHKAHSDIFSTTSANVYRDTVYWEPNIYLKRPEDLSVYGPTGTERAKYITLSPSAVKAKPYLTYIDGKIYYGAASAGGKKITLFSYDLDTGEEQEILQYRRKIPYLNEKGTPCEGGGISLEIDEDYIYCQDYLIPRVGGKMIKAFKKAEKSKRGIFNCAHNKKYIFYVDKKKRVHRITKKTQKDVIISSFKSAGVDCTEEKLYIKVYSRDWYNDRKWAEYNDDDEGYMSPDCYTHDLYCMDLDGKNAKRIWKGRWR